MIVLDTNVVSALMNRTPDMGVARWLDEQPEESVWTTAITVFEVQLGINVLVPSRRRQRLEAAFASVLTQDLDGRILPFDGPAATAAAELSARQRRAGKPIDVRDTEIAGIVAARRATLATRNTRHFMGFGIALVDPWDG